LRRLICITFTAAFVLILSASASDSPGHSLQVFGRFWNIGPQQTLYIPALWLKVGTNEVVIFELEPKGDPKLSGLTAPVYSQ